MLLFPFVEIATGFRVGYGMAVGKSVSLGPDAVRFPGLDAANHDRSRRVRKIRVTAVINDFKLIQIRGNSRVGEIGRGLVEVRGELILIIGGVQNHSDRGHFGGIQLAQNVSAIPGALFQDLGGGLLPSLFRGEGIFELLVLLLQPGDLVGLGAQGADLAAQPQQFIAIVVRDSFVRNGGRLAVGFQLIDLLAQRVVVEAQLLAGLELQKDDGRGADEESYGKCGFQF